MAQARYRTSDMAVQCRRAMRRKINMMRFAQRADLEETGDTTAAGNIGLQHVDRIGLEEAARVVTYINVFPGGDLHLVRRALAHQPQAWQIVRGDRLLEPANVRLRTSVREGQRLFHRQRAVGIDEQLM